LPLKPLPSPKFASTLTDAGLPLAGTCLLPDCGMGKAKIADLSRVLITAYMVMFIGLLVVTRWPGLSLRLLRMFGEFR